MRFAKDDRIRVSQDFFWAKGATGIVSSPPPEVVSISGQWDDNLTRQEISALGENRVYWVWFDEPQRDADGDGPFRGGCIWASALTKCEDT
jgi:hypothetical protein